MKESFPSPFIHSFIHPFVINNATYVICVPQGMYEYKTKKPLSLPPGTPNQTRNRNIKGTATTERMEKNSIAWNAGKELCSSSNPSNPIHPIQPSIPYKQPQRKERQYKEKEKKPSFLSFFLSPFFLLTSFLPSFSMISGPEPFGPFERSK